jgi:two-component sensor histidine kinase
LLAESHHRMKNTLATVQAIAGRPCATYQRPSSRPSLHVCTLWVRPTTC